MPPITPFRAPSSNRHTGSQFASTPRFLLSQRATRPSKQKDDIDTAVPDELPYSTPVTQTRLAPQSGRKSGSARRKEVIEDSEEEEDAATVRPSTREIFDDGENNSPSGFAADVDAQFEALFGSTSDRSKRRRLSSGVETPVAQREKPWTDSILSSSPAAPTSSADPQPSPIPRRVQSQARVDPQPQRTMPAPTVTPRPSTPGIAKTPAFRNQPRFMLSRTPQVSSIQPHPRIPFASGAQTPSSPPQRRKPAFIIPRSPSPSRLDEEAASLPTPFSPSSHTLHRRGRRSNAPAYLPGGMAADVRSWILEMATQRDQLGNSPNARPGASTSVPEVDSKRYCLTARVRNVRQSTLGSAGPVVFVESQSLSTENQDSETFNILLLGPSRAKPVRMQTSPTNHLQLQPDNEIGVCRGLVWGIGLDESETCLPSENEAGQVQDGSHSTSTKQWIVGVEWDLLQ